jgi:hypothetical protein
MSNRMSWVRITALALVFVGTVAAPARADWFFTPYLGVVFGGAANQFATNDFDDKFEQRVNFGGSLGFRTKGVIGFEVDYNVAPNFSSSPAPAFSPTSPWASARFARS